MDIALVAKIGMHKAFRFNRNFVYYRQNLDMDSWACLTKIYPRPSYVLYYFLLFWWADYCKCLPTLLNTPRPSLIAELFFRYVAEIDRIIDTPGGRAIVETPSSLKLNRAVYDIQSELVRHIFSSGISSQAKRNLCHHIWTYRQESLKELQRAYRNRMTDLNQAYAIKRFTAGGLMRTWAQLLAILYRQKASVPHAQNAPQVFFHLSTATQVIDDMMDFPEDFVAGVPNIFQELLESYPMEMEFATEHIKKISWNHLDLAWAENYLPLAYGAALELIDRHLVQATKTSIDSEATSDLCKVIGNLLDHPVGV
jgi:hypothetical protein